ncbi:hypothetical protein PACTADRAFT_81968 [Pachysolen tannophilus NRRL Y-2460]|uniref:Uncharacterized protein n=1 Tax=Pachysolen tannophilus NRRL Y-2460 TaxID=669874 RepID=A0A1E4TRK2_PACTA|nr:hypothetical protein PACTADRAFT_81968 [Pachysolen tannophilus NRRL Y-2460]
MSSNQISDDSNGGPSDDEHPTDLKSLSSSSSGGLTPSTDNNNNDDSSDSEKNIGGLLNASDQDNSNNNTNTNNNNDNNNNNNNNNNSNSRRNNRNSNTVLVAGDELDETDDSWSVIYSTDDSNSFDDNNANVIEHGTSHGDVHGNDHGNDGERLSADAPNNEASISTLKSQKEVTPLVDSSLTLPKLSFPKKNVENDIENDKQMDNITNIDHNSQHSFVNEEKILDYFLEQFNNSLNSTMESIKEFFYASLNAFEEVKTKMLIKKEFHGVVYNGASIAGIALTSLLLYLTYSFGVNQISNKGLIDSVDSYPPSVFFNIRDTYYSDKKITILHCVEEEFKTIVTRSISEEKLDDNKISNIDAVDLILYIPAKYNDFSKNEIEELSRNILLNDELLARDFKEDKISINVNPELGTDEYSEFIVNFCQYNSKKIKDRGIIRYSTKSNSYISSFSNIPERRKTLMKLADIKKLFNLNHLGKLVSSNANIVVANEDLDKLKEELKSQQEIFIEELVNQLNDFTRYAETGSVLLGNIAADFADFVEQNSETLKSKVQCLLEDNSDNINEAKRRSLEFFEEGKLKSINFYKSNKILISKKAKDYKLADHWKDLKKKSVILSKKSNKAMIKFLVEFDEKYDQVSEILSKKFTVIGKHLNHQLDFSASKLRKLTGQLSTQLSTVFSNASENLNHIHKFYISNSKKWGNKSIDMSRVLIEEARIGLIRTYNRAQKLDFNKFLNSSSKAANRILLNVKCYLLSKFGS